MQFFIRSLLFLHVSKTTVEAIILYANATLPGNISDPCSGALLTDVTCDAAVTFFDPAGYYDAQMLQTACNDNCATALKEFEDGVVQACGSETFGGEENWDLSINPRLPIAMIPNKLRFYYGLTCLKDNGRFCNLIAAEAASENQDEAQSVLGLTSTNATQNLRNVSQVRRQADPCDLCMVKSLQYLAAGPYDDGPFLREDLIYELLTSSCGVETLPPSTWTLPYSTTPAPSTPTPSCSGKTYTILGGDTCYSISKSQGIGTGWLLTDNGLLANCLNFPTEGSLCLRNTCKVYEVAAQDTCKSITASNNITIPQLTAWNLVLNQRCDNISKLNGTQLCISNPGTTYVSPTVTIINPTMASTAAPVPAQTGVDSNMYCGAWHLTVLGEFCNILTYKYHISLPDFVFLNPSINENCTNLWENYSYCVEPVGDINTYSGRAGYSTPMPTPTQTYNWDNLPDATFTTPPQTFTPPPLASGVRKDCSRYFLGSDFSEGVSGAGWSISACERATNAYSVTLEDLANWNIGLNTSAADCSFQPGMRYCGQWFVGDSPPIINTPDTPLPIRDGANSNCTEYFAATYGWQCTDILTRYHLTIAQFFSWNPAVGADCSNLWPNYRYCVRIPGFVDPSPSATPTTDPAPTATATSTSKPSPVQDGQPESCNAWHLAISGDGCYLIANDAFITLAQFYDWNPAVGDDCVNGVWLNHYYCIGTQNSGQPTRSSRSVVATSTSAPSAPSPTQANNIISNCNKYHKVVGGDACWSFANRNNISLEQLGTWNALLQPDGSGCGNNFWLNYYYCVGVST